MSVNIEVSPPVHIFLIITLIHNYSSGTNFVKYVEFDLLLALIRLIFYNFLYIKNTSIISVRELLILQL